MFHVNNIFKTCVHCRGLIYYACQITVPDIELMIRQWRLNTFIKNIHWQIQASNTLVFPLPVYILPPTLYCLNDITDLIYNLWLQLMANSGMLAYFQWQLFCKPLKRPTLNSICWLIEMVSILRVMLEN